MLVQPCEGVAGVPEWVDFYLHHDGCIYVKGCGITEEVKVTPVLDLDGTCCFRIGDNPTPTLKRWQLIRMGLEGLFFGNPML